MCEASGAVPHWLLYVADMIEFAEKVLAYPEGMELDGFIADAHTYDATLHNIELIGEAARHVPESVRDDHPDIPWRRIIGTRNRVAHGYLGIDDDVIGDIIRSEVPDLLDKLRSLLPSSKR